MDALQRSSRWWILVLGIAAACSSRPSKPIRYGSLVAGERSFNYVSGIDSFKLPNGLSVALVPDERANLVAVDVRYLVGDIEDPDGKRGLAHVVEHMMFEQRSAAGEPTTGDRLATLALSHNATTTWDATHFHTVALASQLDELLMIEANRMSHGCAGLDQAALDHELAVVTQELTQRGPSPLLDTLLGELYGASHAYTRRATTADVARLTLADVCNFVDAHYAPDRAILVVAGRMDVDVIRTAITTRFASIARRATGARVTTVRQPMTGTVREVRAETDDPAVLVMVPAAPWGSAESFDDALVDGLLMQALAKLDRDEAWITDVETGHLGGARDGARYFGVSVSDAARLDDAVAAVFRAASELPGNDAGLTLGILAAQRRTQLLDDFESIDDRGARCADYLQRTTGRRFLLRELSALEAIDTDRLSARAAYLTRPASRVIRVLPTKAAGNAPAELHVAAAAIDTPTWQAPVDPAEADRPLALPAERRATAVSERRLPNGLRLVMANDFTQPVVDARLVFPVGELSAGPDRAAIANAAASLLDHDVQRFTLRDFAIVNWALRLGAQLSAEVDDHTTFSVRGSSTFADWHLWRLHWLLENGAYDPDDVARAREAAKRPTTRRDHSRSWRLALREAIFGSDHPYARDLDARALTAQLRVDDLEAFREAHYRVGGATLIVVGKFDAAAMARAVTELFGEWPATPPAPPPPIPATRPAAGPVWIAHADPEASQVRITVSFSATSNRVSSRGARAVVGRMVRERVAQIRSRLGASYGVLASYVTTQAGDAIFIDGLVDAGRAGEVLRRMQADIEGLRTGDAAVAADFVRARRAALANALGDPMKASSVADELEAAVAHQLPIDNAATLPAAIAETTLPDARAVLAADLAPARMVVMLSGRPADTAAALRAVNVTRFRTVADPPAASPP
jgi:zinc protease